MRNAIVACIVSLSAFGIESEVQFENEKVLVLKVMLKAHEEVGLHRDELPRVVVAMKGGTITRIEEDGSMKDIDFPKGEAVFLEADPPGQLHRGVNMTCKPMELIIVQLKSNY